MDLTTRLLVIAALAAACLLLTAWYRNRRAVDAAIGVQDATGESLWPTLPSDLTSGSRDASSRAVPTWVIFTTPLCVSCTAVQVDLERSFPHHVVHKVDATERPELAELYGVRRAPTTVLADATGQIVQRLVGPEAVRDFIGALDESALHT